MLRAPENMPPVYWKGLSCWRQMKTAVSEAPVTWFTPSSLRVLFLVICYCSGAPRIHFPVLISQVSSDSSTWEYDVHCQSLAPPGGTVVSSLFNLEFKA